MSRGVWVDQAQRHIRQLWYPPIQAGKKLSHRHLNFKLAVYHPTFLRAGQPLLSPQQGILAFPVETHDSPTTQAGQ